MVETISYRRRNLPHWIVADRSYFVTFRQKGTIPVELFSRLRSEREIAQRDGWSVDKLVEMDKRHFEHIESILDSYDPEKSVLLTTGVPEIILESISWLESEREWKVFAAVIMPSHVHLLLRNFGGHSDSLNEDIGKVKRFSSTRINRILGKKGDFWQSENFDHWCRTPDSFDRYYNYILNNPVKAGLVEKWEDWKWMIVNQRSDLSRRIPRWREKPDADLTGSETCPTGQ